MQESQDSDNYRSKVNVKFLYCNTIIILQTAHVSGCLIKRSPSTYVGLPRTDGNPETTFYGCVSTATNCEYEVHVIANYESSDGCQNGFGENTYVDVNILGQSSKPLIFVFMSYRTVNWHLNLPSGVVVDRILVVSSLPQLLLKQSCIMLNFTKYRVGTTQVEYSVIQTPKLKLFHIM